VLVAATDQKAANARGTHFAQVDFLGAVLRWPVPLTQFRSQVEAPLTRDDQLL
jgi:hypothetical protein